MNLYVATYQLHATLDPADLADDRRDRHQPARRRPIRAPAPPRRGEGYEIALLEGMYDAVLPLYDGDNYKGGDPMVDQTLRDGVVRPGRPPSRRLWVAVPLRVQNDIVGALVVLKLLDHKPILRAEDRDLLDLLSAHAASAMSPRGCSPPRIASSVRSRAWSSWLAVSRGGTEYSEDRAQAVSETAPEPRHHGNLRQPQRRLRRRRDAVHSPRPADRHPAALPWQRAVDDRASWRPPGLRAGAAHRRSSGTCWSSRG